MTVVACFIMRFAWFRIRNHTCICRLPGGRNSGRRILDGEPEVRVLGHEFRCVAAWIRLGLSAHADWKEVIRWLEDCRRGRVKLF